MKYSNLKNKLVSLAVALSMVTSFALPGINVEAKAGDVQVHNVEETKQKISSNDEKANKTKDVQTIAESVQPVIEEKKEETKIQLIGFNDFHGNVIEAGKNVGGAKFVGEINRLKAENPNTFVIGAGDIYQGTAISNLLYGEPLSKMLQEAGVKYSAVGNHEFDWGVDKISKWEEDGGLNFLASNIYDKDTGKPVTWADPYGIIEADGKKIGIVGLTTPETAFKTKLENVDKLIFKDVVESSKHWAEYLRDVEKVDAVVVVGHVGSEQDKATGEITGEAAEIAKNVKGIDAIISAHTHMFVDGKVNNVPIVQAGNNGRGLSKVELIFDAKGNLKVEAKLDKIYERVSNLPEDAKMKSITDNYKKELTPIMSEVVANVNAELDHDRFGGLSALGQFATKYMAQGAKTQIAITNGGGLRRPIKAGDITVGDMWEVMPFDNTVVTMKLKGSDLKRVIENGIMNTSIGWVQYYGLKVYYDKDAEAGKRITSMRLLDGTKIKDDEYYTVATNDFILNKGDNYDFSGAKDIVDTQKPIRDELIRVLKPLKNIEFKFDAETLVPGKDPVVDKTNGNSKTEVKAETVVEVKPDAEIKPSTEVKPTVEIKDNTVSKENNKNTKLPQTGSAVDPRFIAIMGLMLVASGIVISKKKKKVI